MHALFLMASLGLGAADQRQVLQELEQLDKKLVAAEREIEATSATRDRFVAELARVEAALAATRVKHDTVHAQYRRRIRALSRLPGGARLLLLGGSQSLSDYLESSRVLRLTAAHDAKLQARYRAEREALTQAEATLERHRAEVEKVDATARAQRDTLAAKRAERVEFLKSLLGSAELKERVGRESTTAQRQLVAMVRQLAPQGKQSVRFGANKGRLPWPAMGKVTSHFGQQIEKAFGTVTSKNGIEIAAPAGERVQAVAPGVVVFADWMRGYGQLVVVDHGDETHTLAAHLGELMAAVGDRVEQGQTLGTVGDTGSLTGSMLYFEIRRRGAAEDPVPWLRR